MELWLKEVAEAVGLLLEAIVVLVVTAGSLRAIFDLSRAAIRRSLDIGRARIIWVRFAASILLALEFALGADLVQTAIAPSWDEIGQLAAIAAIRTALGFFLGRDIEVFGSTEE